MAIRIIRKGKAESNIISLLESRILTLEKTILNLENTVRYLTSEDETDCVIEYIYDSNNVLIGQNITSNNNRKVVFEYTGNNITKETITYKDKIITNDYVYTEFDNLLSLTSVTLFRNGNQDNYQTTYEYDNTNTLIKTITIGLNNCTSIFIYTGINITKEINTYDYKEVTIDYVYDNSNKLLSSTVSTTF